MRALIIKPKPLELILSSLKVWELRGSRTHVRGPIKLIASGTGLIIGQAVLVDCIGPLDKSTYESERSKHHSTKPFEEQYAALYAWVFEGARRIEPVPYSHPKGAIIWVKIPDS
ncbi:MAG: hypothetical protein ACMXYM_02600 [Candidatus Woesearchaeota archaeon]